MPGHNNPNRDRHPGPGSDPQSSRQSDLVDECRATSVPFGRICAALNCSNCPPISDAIQQMSIQLATFFTHPELCRDDYADLFLMYLGEDLEARLPQGLVRGYQNLYGYPVQVIMRSLDSLFAALQQKRPSFSEKNLEDHINWFLTFGDGYIDRRIARIAMAAPYNGKVVSTDSSARKDLRTGS